MQTTPDRHGPARPFDVIAVDSDHGPAGWRSVGHYAHLDDAIRARVNDVLVQLARNDGWLVTAEHLVVGPGEDGPATVRCCLAEVGADPASDRLPDPMDLDDTRHWLLAAHGLL